MEEDRGRRLAEFVAKRTNDEQKAALNAWANQLLIIKSSDASLLQKQGRMLKASARMDVLKPVFHMIGKEMKRLGWDERRTHERWGIGAAAAAFVALGNSGAGIAAFGTAIGVPLWVLFGGGAMFLSLLIQELHREQKPTTFYDIEGRRQPEDE